MPKITRIPHIGLLRAIVEALGYAGAPPGDAPKAAAAIEAALVRHAAGGASPPRVAPLAERDREPDRFALVDGAAFLCCATGIQDGVLQKAFGRAAGDMATARNRTTMTQLVALAAQAGG